MALRRMVAWPLPRPLRVVLFGAASTVLLWLSLAPTKELPQGVMFWDKAEHAIAYLTLTFGGLVLFPRHPRGLAAFAVGMGGGVELLQATMGFGRQGDWRDMAANTLGVAAAFALAAMVRVVRRRLG